MKTEKIQIKQLFLCWKEVAGRFSSSVVLEQFGLKTEKAECFFTGKQPLCHAQTNSSGLSVTPVTPLLRGSSLCFAVREVCFIYVVKDIIVQIILDIF